MPTLSVSISLNELAEQIAMAIVNDECTINEVISFVKCLDTCIAEEEFTDKMYTYFEKEYTTFKKEYTTLLKK